MFFKVGVKNAILNFESKTPNLFTVECFIPLLF